MIISVIFLVDAHLPLIQFSLEQFSDLSAVSCAKPRVPLPVPQKTHLVAKQHANAREWLSALSTAGLLSFPPCINED